jgi:hypothetical protein
MLRKGGIGENATSAQGRSRCHSQNTPFDDIVLSFA